MGKLPSATNSHDDKRDYTKFYPNAVLNCLVANRHIIPLTTHPSDGTIPNYYQGTVYRTQPHSSASWFKTWQKVVPFHSLFLFRWEAFLDVPQKRKQKLMTIYHSHMGEQNIQVYWKLYTSYDTTKCNYTYSFVVNLGPGSHTHTYMNTHMYRHNIHVQTWAYAHSRTTKG